MISPALLWVDIETTGLTDADKTLAVGVVLTNAYMDDIYHNEWYIRHPSSVFDLMPPHVREMHTTNNVITTCLASKTSLEQVNDEIMTILSQHTKRKDVYMAGSSIHMDRRFLARDLPAVIDWLHYRMLDVSALRVIRELQRPDTIDRNYQSAHTPLADIRRSQFLLNDNLSFIKPWPTGSK